jgi:hypothetical protein
MIVINVYGGLIKSFIMLGCMLKIFFKLFVFCKVLWAFHGYGQNFQYWKSNDFIGQDSWQGCFWGTTTNYPFIIILA